MSAAITTHQEWVSRLRDLIDRRPELAEVGLAPMVCEVTA